MEIWAMVLLALFAVSFVTLVFSALNPDSWVYRLIDLALDEHENRKNVVDLEYDDFTGVWSWRS